MQVLDLSHNKIDSLSALHFRIGNVAKISLASNEIKSLNGKSIKHLYDYCISKVLITVSAEILACRKFGDSV